MPSFKERKSSVQSFFKAPKLSHYYYYYLFIFTEDSFFSAYCAVINDGPAIEVLIIFKTPI